MKEKRDGFPDRIWKLLLPLLLYYGVFLASFFLLSFLLRMLTGVLAGGTGEGSAEAAAGIGKLIEGNGETLTGIVNGISMLTGAAALIPMLRAELKEHSGKYFQQDKQRQSNSADRTNRALAEIIRKKQGRKGLRTGYIVLMTVVSASSSAIGLNLFLSLTGLVQRSADYQEVAQRQYGVAFGVGLFLYTVVSPLAEEIVFRGVLYNRMRRYFREWREEREKRRQTHDADGQRQRNRTKKGKGQNMDAATVAAVMASGILFGIYHGNPVQAVYGGCLGILMACFYERTHRFYIPCLFHAAANCAVYLLAQNAALQERIFTVPWCAALLVTAAIAVIVVFHSMSSAFFRPGV